MSLEYAEGLIKKARDLVSKAEEEFNRYGDHSNIVLWCQEAIELCGKAIFKIMGLDFPKEHQLLFAQKGEVKSEVKKLLESEFPKYFAYKEDIPRVVFLTYFWHDFYTIAKYGLSEINIPPGKLFLKEDAELALKHAKDCVNVAENLFYLKKSEKEK